jgi:hypothetical protein
MHSSLYVEPAPGEVITPRSEAAATVEHKESPIGVWKIAFGVFLGNLMFGVVASIFYAITK